MAPEKRSWTLQRVSRFESGYVSRNPIGMHPPEVNVSIGKRIAWTGAE
jgi:hypothetical protein